jgi:hypothetical protein
MHSMRDDDNATGAVGTLLTAAAPWAPADDERVTGLSATLAREVVEADREARGRVRRLRRRHRVAVATAAAAVLLVPPGAWAAQHFLAQTGQHDDGTLNPGLRDSSELIDTCAADFAEYVATLAPTDLPAAPGHTWREYAQRSAGQWVGPGSCAPQQQGLVQDSTLRLDLLAAASGDWGCALVWADRDGERDVEAGARTAMRGLEVRARSLSAVEGSVGTWDPDVFLDNSRLPQFTGCER